MNSEQFIISSIVFLIEARKYDIAASYLLYDACNFRGVNNIYNGRKSVHENLHKELRQRHEAIRRQYPSRLTLEQMREIARETYEQVYQATLSGEGYSSLVYSEKPNI